MIKATLSQINLKCKFIQLFKEHVLPYSDSVGMNEQELPNLLSLMKTGKVNFSVKKLPDRLKSHRYLEHHLTFLSSRWLLILIISMSIEFDMNQNTQKSDNNY